MQNINTKKICRNLKHKWKCLKNKKFKSIVFVLLMFTVAITGITYAIMQSKTEFDNTFKTSKYDVAIEEEFYNDFGTKKVSFINNDEVPLVLRVNYNEKWSSVSEGATLLLSNTYKGRDLVIKEWTETWNNDFIQGIDGWYYYKYIFDSNSSVQVLNSITKNEELLSRKSDYEQYLKSDYELDFNFEVTQADIKAIKELWNIDVSISEKEVTWKF